MGERERETGQGEMVECFLLSRSGKSSGDHLGALTPPTSLLGKCPVQCPFHDHPPSLAVWGHESALTAC